MQVIICINVDAQYMNDIWEFNTITMKWIEHKTYGKIPACRSNCTMHYEALHNNIIVFGGGGSNKKRFNDVYILDWKNK
jgi:N-acetylneuraminic acid mutarotase